MYNYVLIILPNNLVKKLIMFMSNYTNMRYEKNVSSVDVCLVLVVSCSFHLILSSCLSCSCHLILSSCCVLFLSCYFLFLLFHVIVILASCCVLLL